MYVLEFLSGKLSGKEERRAEYRMVCSGALYNRRVLTTDWRKSDASRILLIRPASLCVVSRPLDDYPQEMSLHVTVSRIMETDGNFTTTFYPDDIVARDLTSILSVILRRHLAIAAKVAVSAADGVPAELAPSGVISLPLVGQTRNSAWPRHPLGVLTTATGEVKVDDYNPPPLGVDPSELSRALLAVAQAEHAEAFVLATRLYSQAMESLGSDPETSYQLLISAVETLANAALANYKPSRSEMLEAKKAVLQKAFDFGLSQAQAEELALLACADNRWISRRFRRFLTSLVPPDSLKRDDLFNLPSELCPPPEHFETALRAIYASRGAAVHAGRSWHETIRLGWGPTFPVGALRNLLAGELRDPPLVWFERVVNIALNRYLDPAIRKLLS
jgi:hypothetical protein